MARSVPPAGSLDAAIASPYPRTPMATVAHKVYALVRERQGITSEELRRALGTDVDRALRRLVQVGYIRRVRSGMSHAYYYPTAYE
jgi:chromosome segregation and condensation protein ScpB